MYAYHSRVWAHGITLIELLVVIGIITLLMSIFLPAMGRVRETAVAVQCLSHLRQLGVATTGYVADHRFCYPQPSVDKHVAQLVAGPSASNETLNQIKGAHVWYNALDYYLNQDRKTYDTNSNRNHKVFKQCPVWVRLHETPSLGGEFNKTFKMNEFFGDPGTNAATTAPGGVYFAKVDAVKRPSRTVVYFDAIAQDFWPDNSISGFSGRFHGGAPHIVPRHADAVNVLLADGSAGPHKQALDLSQTWQGWFAEPDPRQNLVWNFRAGL